MPLGHLPKARLLVIRCQSWTGEDCIRHPTNCKEMFVQWRHTVEAPTSNTAQIPKQYLICTCKRLPFLCPQIFPTTVFLFFPSYSLSVLSASGLIRPLLLSNSWAQDSQLKVGSTAALTGFPLTCSGVIPWRPSSHDLLGCERSIRPGQRQHPPVLT